MTGDPSSDIIRLDEHDVIDLSDAPEPTLMDVVRSPAVRRAATRAVLDLEQHHGHAPWIVICPLNGELIASSPSFDESVDWKAQADVSGRFEQGDVPLAVLSLAPDGLDDDPAARAGELVARALSEIVVAERRAAAADARAGRAEAMASTDALTGVGNQRAWWERIAEEEAHRARAARAAVIAVIDLDDLKEMNDQRGHLHGDLLLRLAAQTLRRAVRPFDVVARVGGDEFAVMAVDYEGDPRVFAARLGDALEAADIHASLGVAMPMPTESLTDAYADADRAMYAQKRHRRQRTGA